MQFNSYFFILAFLPLAIVGYFGLNKINAKLGSLFLVVMSAWFYGTDNIKFLLLLCVSICINFLLSYLIARYKRGSKCILTLGILLNVLLLFYFKYYNFTIANINLYFGTNIIAREILLPLGISFFTFQQIAYLVDTYRGETKENTFIDYVLYVMFFPKLLMGPLVYQSELIPQFKSIEKRKINPDNIVAGIQMFGMGLFKKVLLADTFATAVAWGEANFASSSSADFLVVMLSYTFQIYFDFSGYSDMAIGVAKMMNIELPINFDSPYKAMSIRDFWKRWHISLTKFLTNYIYIPLGGSRKGKIRTYINVLVVFLISGIWHGANWTFILWGILHGLGSVLDRVVEKKYVKVHPAVQWFVTFASVNVLWLLFRAKSVSDWMMQLKHIFTFSNMAISEGLINSFVLPEFDVLFTVLQLNGLNGQIHGFSMLILLVGAFVICMLFENNYRREKKANVLSAIATAIAIAWSMICLSVESVFVYFNF